VLPFGLEKRAAASAVQTWLASRWFAPSALTRLARPEAMQGVYVPYWTYDAQSWSSYTGKRGAHYYETEYVTVQNARGEAVREQRQVRRTRWTPVSGEVRNSFDDVLVPASRSIGERRLRELAPWDLQAVTAYEGAYLAGFKAQRYQVELGEGYEKAKKIMSAAIEDSVATDIGGDEQDVDSIHTEWSGLTFKHILLPVWIGAYRFGERPFQVTVNARTGEVQGERPYSKWKIALAVLAVAAAILLIVWLRRR
jgi:hypothetical protein